MLRIILFFKTIILIFCIKSSQEGDLSEDAVSIPFIETTIMDELEDEVFEFLDNLGRIVTSDKTALDETETVIFIVVLWFETITSNDITTFTQTANIHQNAFIIIGQLIQKVWIDFIVIFQQVQKEFGQLFREEKRRFDEVGVVSNF